MTLPPEIFELYDNIPIQWEKESDVDIAKKYFEICKQKGQNYISSKDPEYGNYGI